MPVRMMTPIDASSRATENASYISVTVSGVNALRRSGRLMVIFAIPSAVSYLISRYCLADFQATSSIAVLSWHIVDSLQDAKRLARPATETSASRRRFRTRGKTTSCRRLTMFGSVFSLRMIPVSQVSISYRDEVCHGAAGLGVHDSTTSFKIDAKTSGCSR